MMRIYRDRRFAMLMSVILLLTTILQFGVVFAAQGSIKTTDIDDSVNINHYDLKTDVYVRPDNQESIPEGSYVVHVIAPNGDLLGTSGTLTPFVIDSEGKIVGGVLLNNGVKAYHLWDLVNKISDGTQGYDDTTNNGNEYKVDLLNASGESKYKSDNFKVIQEVTTTTTTTEPTTTTTTTTEPTTTTTTGKDTTTTTTVPTTSTTTGNETTTTTTGDETTTTTTSITSGDQTTTTTSTTTRDRTRRRTTTTTGEETTTQEPTTAITITETSPPLAPPPTEVFTEPVVPLGVPVLPKTGELPVSLFYGLGGVITAIGLYLKRK